jgi:cyclin H
MIEDDYYRASTQYRYWSYTPQQLAEIRRQTNELASEKVRAAFRRARSQRSGNDDQEGADSTSDETPINTLTVEEELKIVAWGCGKIIEMGESMKPRVPTHVVVSHAHFWIPRTDCYQLLYALCRLSFRLNPRTPLRPSNIPP